MIKKCNNCGSEKFALKNIYLAIKDIESQNLSLRLLDLLPIKNELFYLKICLECGKVEIYSAAVVCKDEEDKIKAVKNE